ncbi:MULTISPECIES: siderophore-interacting protein [unclassified Microbacterium]|uniref:siderophore-interacting protein n=1 Tax=unclassified Microbacterium TaxID=2609290 RepID=UPI0025CF2293|nr:MULTISPECIES: siderophore-interacting protein [unclassified Microbacterium]
MARDSGPVKPASQDLLHLTVLRTERLTPHWMRVTLGGGDIARFTPMGYDQWFRIFLPHTGAGGDEGLERIPAKANKIFGYLKYLRIPEGMRPVMRNYTVRAYGHRARRAAPRSTSTSSCTDRVRRRAPRRDGRMPQSRASPS